MVERDEPSLGPKIATDVAMAAVGSVPVIGRALEGVLDVVRDIRNSRVTKFAEAVETIIVETSSVIELEQVLLRDPESAELFEHGARVSADSRTDAKIRGLSRVVAEGLLSGHGLIIDYAHILITAIEPLDELHIKIMMWIEDRERDPNSRYDVPAAAGRRSISALSAEHPDVSDVAAPLMAFLVGQGLVENVGPGRMGGAGEAEMWSLTSLGRSILRYLREEDNS